MPSAHPTAIGSDVRPHSSSSPEYRGRYFSTSKRRAIASSSASTTTRATAARRSSPIRIVTAGFARRFFTQSLRSPPPESMYATPSASANQISISWGSPLTRPVVDR